MLLIEIRLGTGLLFIGTPLAIDPVMSRADDPFQRMQLLRSLHTDRYAMARLRTLYPMLATQNLDPGELVVRLCNDLRSGRLKAAYVRESGGDIEPVELPIVPGKIVHLELKGVTLLLAPRGTMPTQFRNVAKSSELGRALRQIGPLIAKVMQGQAGQAKPGGVAGAAGAAGAAGPVGGMSELGKALANVGPMISGIIQSGQQKSAGGMGSLSDLHDAFAQIGPMLEKARQSGQGGGQKSGLTDLGRALAEVGPMIGKMVKASQAGGSGTGGSGIGSIGGIGKALANAGPTITKAMEAGQGGSGIGSIGGIGKALANAGPMIGKAIQAGQRKPGHDGGPNAPAIALIAGLDPEGPEMRMLFRQMHRLTIGLDIFAKGRDLQRALIRHLTNGLIESVVLADPRDISMAKARRETPPPVETMTPSQRVAEAIMRSRQHLHHEVQAVAEEMTRPNQLPGLTALLHVAAMAHANPLSAALLDSTLVLIAWSMGGMAAVQALGQVYTAVLEAAAADVDDTMEEVSKQLAKAFNLLGASVLTAIMARSFSRKGGTQASDGSDWSAKMQSPVQVMADTPRPSRPRPIYRQQREEPQSAGPPPRPASPGDNPVSGAPPPVPAAIPAQQESLTQGTLPPKATKSEDNAAQEAIAKDPGIAKAMQEAWEKSKPNGPKPKKEHGFWIVKDKKTGALSTVDFPSNGATNDKLIPGPMPSDPDKEVVSFFHTHPNTAAEGYVPEPSPADKAFAQKRGLGGIVYSHDGMFYF